MTDCVDCAVLERRVSGLSADLRRAQDERDRLAAAGQRVAGDRDRHWYRLVCDRCGASIAVTSTFAVGGGEFRQALGDLARRIGWLLGQATGRELLLASDGERDLCPLCVTAVASR